MLANDTRKTPTTMNAHERLTWEEMCRRYPDEWVVVVAIQPVDQPNQMDEGDEADEVDDVCCVPIEDCTAVVVAHGKNRKSLSLEIKALQPHHPGLGAFFTGRLIPPAYELVMP